MKKAISILLTLMMVLAMVPASAAAASQAYGSEVWMRSTPVYDGATLSRNIYWSEYYSQLRRENYITYTPGYRFKTAVAYGQSVCERLTTGAAAAEYEAAGYRVVGAINGDFYDTATGYPLGLLVSGGELLSGSENYYAVGFRGDGSVVMGKPNLKITASSGFGKTAEIKSFNKPRVENGGLTLITADFRTDKTTGTSTQGVTALCTLLYGKASVGGQMTVRVDGVLDSAEAVTLADNQVALTAAAAGSSDALQFLRSLMTGESLTISFAADSGWETVTEAVGALHLLVENGTARSGFEAGNAPRTAIGVKASGEVVLYTVDGRQTGYSMGASLNVLAQRMAELGCMTALCLDGGGSTTLVSATPDRATARVINSPSDKNERKSSNHILILASGQSAGWGSHVYLETDAPAVLAGQTMELKANLVDGSYRPTGGAVTVTSSAGQVVGNTFYAPQQSGPVTITAAAGGQSTSVTVQVVSAPDKMTVLWDGKDLQEVTMFPGDKAQLTAQVSYNHLPLTTAAADFHWSIDSSMGSFDGNGLLTTVFAEGSGPVTVTQGSISRTIQLTLDAKSPFADTQGHWGGAYMASLYHKGVLTGVVEKDLLYAYPDKGVTRMEFAVLLARFMGLNTADYAEVEVPFADMEKVDAWAADAVRAMYAHGIVGGITLADGTQIFDPRASLTRAQAVTMLGRSMEEKAWADLSQFKDAGDILPYAEEHFRTMVGLGVVGGSYGKLDPNGTMTRAAICKVLATMP